VISPFALRLPVLPPRLFYEFLGWFAYAFPYFDRRTEMKLVLIALLAITLFVAYVVAETAFAAEAADIEDAQYSCRLSSPGSGVFKVFHVGGKNSYHYVKTAAIRRCKHKYGKSYSHPYFFNCGVGAHGYGCSFNCCTSHPGVADLAGY
jgi:hypothetical protein